MGNLSVEFSAFHVKETQPTFAINVSELLVFVFLSEAQPPAYDSTTVPLAYPNVQPQPQPYVQPQPQPYVQPQPQPYVQPQPGHQVSP